MHVITRFTNLINSEIPAELSADTHRQIETLAEILAANPTIESAIETSPITETLPRAWTCSLFAAKQCLQRPENLLNLLNNPDSQKPYNPGELTNNIATRTETACNYDELAQTVRQIRNQEMIRLAWRDATGQATLSEVVTTMSDLADGLVDSCLKKLTQWHTESKGVPRSATSGEPVELTVLGMGKLGAHELNFSSDIDLIFCYSDDGETDGDKPVPNQVFFTQLGQKLIAVLNDFTADGFVFRVDMRLRPFGDSGPIVMNFCGIENYYQIHGREWERYALIKARPIAGDIQAGNQLLKTLKPFIFRRYLDFGTIDSLREMKRMIAAEMRRKELVNHIKLGSGGIREIEFIGQALQLIHGGQNSDLQERGILLILENLAKRQIIPEIATVELTQAYEFLRKTEHCLQMVNDQQTHCLPTDSTEQTRLAFAMNFEDWSAFTIELNQHMAATERHFAALFSDQTEDHKDNLLLNGWSASAYSESIESDLAEIGFKHPKAAFDLLQGLKGGGKYRSATAQGRERLEKLLQLLSEKIQKSNDPDRLLPRIIALIEAILTRSAYISLLIENEHALEQVIRLFSLSQWIANWITNHPILLDRLLNSATLNTPINSATLLAEIDARLAVFDADDLESQMNALREFRHAFVLQVAASEIALSESSEQTGQKLSSIADTACRKAFELARSHLTTRFGQPMCESPDGPFVPELMVVAYGKLGSWELGYQSDLDLVFVHNSNDTQGMTAGEKSVANAVYFTKMCQRFIHIISTNTSAGSAYEIDTRLRPSGNSGPLTTSLSAFEAYQLKQAWTWEHQALVRARVIVGTTELTEAFQKVRQRILCLPRDPDKLRTDVIDMRQKLLLNKPDGQGVFDIKYDRGSILDIEFISQYLVLKCAHDCPEMSHDTNTVAILNTAKTHGLLTNTQHQQLVNAFQVYLKTSRMMKLTDGIIDSVQNELMEHRQSVSACWQTILGDNRA